MAQRKTKRQHTTISFPLSVAPVAISAGGFGSLLGTLLFAALLCGGLAQPVAAQQQTPPPEPTPHVDREPAASDDSPTSIFDAWNISREVAERVTQRAATSDQAVPASDLGKPNGPDGPEVSSAQSSAADSSPAITSAVRLFSSGGQDASKQSTGDAADPTEQQREWLRAQFTDGVSSVRQLETINERLNAMTAEEVNRRFLVEQDRAQQAALAAQNGGGNLQGNMLPQNGWMPGIAAGRFVPVPGAGFPIWPRRRVVGFAPTVQWFPTSGTQFAIDPYGGMYFNNSTYWPCSAYDPYCYGGYGYPYQWSISRPDPAPQPRPQREIWYDGLRTRVGPPGSRPE